MVNFYRRFLPAVAKSLKPLTDALRGNLKSGDVIAWSPECAAAFTAAKHALLQATHLAHPTAGASLSLAVDASATHVGAALQQQLQLQGEFSSRPLGFFPKNWRQLSKIILHSTESCLPSMQGYVISATCLRGESSRCTLTTNP
jgi:hypothetical protein